MLISAVSGCTMMFAMLSYSLHRGLSGGLGSFEQWREAGHFVRFEFTIAKVLFNQARKHFGYDTPN